MNESRIAAQMATVEDLTHQIAESKAAHAAGRKMDGKRTKCQDNLTIGELEPIKRELNKLKLDMACVLDEKGNAEKEKDYYLSREESQQRSVEALTREIAESNEEHTSWLS